jgi:chromosome segregation ATPase
MDFKKLEIPEDAQAAIQKELTALEKARDESAEALKKANEAVEKLTAEVAELKKPEDKEPDPVEKASPEVQAKFEELEKQRKEDAEALKKATDRVAKMEDAQRLSKAIETVSEWENLPTVTADDFAPVLKRVREKLDEEDVKRIETALNAANSAIRQSDLLKVSGRDGGGGEVTERVEKMAKDRLQANPEKTYEQHYADILEADPNLYDQMRSETGRAE